MRYSKEQIAKALDAAGIPKYEKGFRPVRSGYRLKILLSEAKGGGHWTVSFWGPRYNEHEAYYAGAVGKALEEARIPYSNTGDSWLIPVETSEDVI